MRNRIKSLQLKQKNIETKAEIESYKTQNINNIQQKTREQKQTWEKKKQLLEEEERYRQQMVARRKSEEQRKKEHLEALRQK